MVKAQLMFTPACRRPTGRIRGSGFTLIELLVTISITAILLSAATPSFRDFVLGQRLKTASYDVAYTLIYARSEAIKRNSGVAMVPATGGWQNGWTVTAGATILSQHEAFSGLTITGPAGNVAYGGDGRLSAPVNPFAISTNTSALPRCVSVDLSGLPSSKIGGC